MTEGDSTLKISLLISNRNEKLKVKNSKCRPFSFLILNLESLIVHMSKAKDQQLMTNDLIQKKDLYASYEESDERMTWCSECGNYGIQKAVFRALALEGIEQDQ